MSDILRYKDYCGSVEFSAEDNCLYGKILGINDLVSFEGKTVEDLRSDFEESVDDYLETCANLGKQPEKEYKGTFNVRISPELHKRAAIEAAKEKQSLNWVIGRAVAQYLSRGTR